MYITKHNETKAYVAFVGEEQNFPTTNNVKKVISVDFLNQEPPLSTLVQQKYQAIVSVNKEGVYEIQTLLNNDFELMLRSYFNSSELNLDSIIHNETRNIGTNIIGFTMMFMLMFSFWVLSLFAIDKEQGLLLRIASTPVSLLGYLFAHIVFVLGIIIPELLLLAVLKIGGWNIGFSLFQFLGILALQAFLGISLALLLFTLIKKTDNAIMFGSAIVILTTVLAGGFFSLNTSNKRLNSIKNILPQKYLLHGVELLEKGKNMVAIQNFFVVLVFSICLLLISFFLLNKKYSK